MKLIGRIDDKEHNIELERNGERVVADVDGRKYELEISQPEPGVYLIRDGVKIHEATVSKSASGETTVSIKGREFEVSIIDPKRLRGAAGSAGSHDGTAEIKTAMPGKVVRVLTEAGSEVKKGDPLIVVEAMKMQNEMKSPKDGVIRTINAAEGDTVNAGTVLVVID